MSYIYHEKQEASLCGQHALNNLCQQGMVFSAMLDEKERKVMLEMGHNTADAAKFLAEESGNVDAAGNFSISVLSEAMKRRYQVTLVNSENEEVKGKLTTTGYAREEGFVLNRHSHWLAVRRIRDKYWNLNSTEDEPSTVGEFALEATLAQYVKDGYNVFVVRGITSNNKLPPPVSDSAVELMHLDGPEAPSWRMEADIGRGGSGKRAAEGEPSSGGGSVYSGGGSEASKKPHSWAESGPGRRLDGGSGSADSNNRDRDSSSRGGLSPPRPPPEFMSEDEQMAAAIAASLGEEAVGPTDSTTAGGGGGWVPVCPPEEPANLPGETVTVQVKLPGRRVRRRFPKSDNTSVLFDFVAFELAKADGKGSASSAFQTNFELVAPGGKKLAREEAGSLQEEGLGGASVMVLLR